MEHCKKKVWAPLLQITIELVYCNTSSSNKFGFCSYQRNDGFNKPFVSAGGRAGQKLRNFASL